MSKRLLLMGILVATRCIQPVLALDWQAFVQFSEDATHLEHQGKWREIHWFTDFDEAQQRALREDKPILVFMVVQHRGDLKADDC